MNREFEKLIGVLESKLRELVRRDPLRFDALPPDLPARAVYLLSGGRRHLYVGRTNRLRQRLRNHCSGSPSAASFAFQIARRKTRQTKATYTTKGSRAKLMEDPTFAAAFAAATRRIAAMSIRYVEERDPRRQALLEIYAATALRTSYNDFDNH